MKKLNMCILILIAFLSVTGCSKEDKNFNANNKKAFDACINSGGVPLQAWFNEKVLGGCIYKPIDE
jgi:hypothetical protein